MLCLLLGAASTLAAFEAVSVVHIMLAHLTCSLLRQMRLQHRSVLCVCTGGMQGHSTQPGAEHASINRLQHSSGSMSTQFDSDNTKQLHTFCSALQDSGHVCWLSSAYQILPNFSKITSSTSVHCDTGKRDAVFMIIWPSEVLCEAMMHPLQLDYYRPSFTTNDFIYMAVAYTAPVSVTPVLLQYERPDNMPSADVESAYWPPLMQWRSEVNSSANSSLYGLFGPEVAVAGASSV